ncbi:MAG: PilZ domain-containing protein [Candidatus Sulfotelmatobacter sp.]
MKLHAQNQPAGNSPEFVDARRKQRFKFRADIKIDSRTCGVINGYTVDISESGVSALLKIEVPIGELLELQFMLPFGPVRVYATVRQRNAFRYGFQFVESHSMHEVIQATCRSLAVEQSLFGGNAGR